MNTIEDFIKFLREKEPHSMIMVSTVADVLESIILPTKLSKEEETI